MRTRKEINMAAAEALSVMLEETIRRRRENSAISQIVQSGFDTEEVRRLADEAASAYAAGDIAAFEALYREALNRIPGIDRLQGYFTGPGGGEAVSNAILQGEAFYQEGNYRGALDSYTAALVYDARYREQEPRIREHLQRSGYEVASREERRRETQGAAPLMNRGDNFYSAGRYQDAAASYMSVLEQYPYCDQVPAAIAGLKRSMDAQTQAVMVPAAADTTELAALRSQNEALSRTVDELRRNHAAELQRRETQIRAEYGERTSSTVTVVDDRYNQLMSLYRDYTRRDDAAITQAAGHVSGIVQAKNILDEFLVSEAVTAVFPGLSDRIKRYDRAFTAAGHDDALMRAADFALRLSTQRSGAEMERYLAAEIGRNSGDPWMRDYLETLRGFIR
jgi:tetratricopeptide (TPR) repeat protein